MSLTRGSALLFENEPVEQPKAAKMRRSPQRAVNTINHSPSSPTSVLILPTHLVGQAYRSTCCLKRPPLKPTCQPPTESQGRSRQRWCRQHCYWSPRRTERCSKPHGRRCRERCHPSSCG